ncbi:m023.5L [Anopheles sinensis]|uniref:M023.5L n=1 Tax=Anopheles sinensis TaxID=74873 RepID=A0A084WJQ2_ANOSI|nr:m023.5L [Anopheles sinensis]
MEAGIAVPFAPAATTAGCGGAVVVPVLKRFLSFGRERRKELLMLMGLLVVVMVVLLVKAAVAKVGQQ